MRVLVLYRVTLVAMVNTLYMLTLTVMGWLKVLQSISMNKIMNIQDFLHYDFRRYGEDTHKETSEYTYKVEIREVLENPYYLPFGDHGVHHWELVINVLKLDHLYDDEPDNETNLMTDGSPLRFKMTSYSKQPTIEEFSQHIYNELRAVLQAFGSTDEFIWGFTQMIERTEITPEILYKFLKNIHKDYTKTEDFLRDYDHYLERFYHDYKFFTYLCFSANYMFAMGWDYPIGEHMIAFLDLGKYYDHYERNLLKDLDIK